MKSGKRAGYAQGGEAGGETRRRSLRTIALELGALLRRLTFGSRETSSSESASPEASARLLSNLATEAGFVPVDLDRSHVDRMGFLNPHGKELIAAHAKIGVLPSAGPKGRPMVVRLRPPVPTRPEDGDVVPNLPVLELLVADTEPKARLSHKPLPCLRTTVRHQPDGLPPTVVADEFGWVCPPDAEGNPRPFMPGQRPNSPAPDSAVLPEYAPAMTAAELAHLESHLTGVLWAQQFATSPDVFTALQLPAESTRLALQ